MRLVLHHPIRTSVSAEDLGWRGSKLKGRGKKEGTLF